MGCFNLVTSEALEQMDNASRGVPQSPPGTLAHATAQCRDMALTIASVSLSPKLSNQTRSALVPALSKVLSITKNPLGLFEKAPEHHGPRSTGLLPNLSHSTQGEAFAYELLGTAALIQIGAKEITGTGPTLHIQPGDRIDFGIKHQAHYAVSNDILSTNTSRSTVESDLLIHRGTEVIGVDFKHSHDASYASNIQGELKGVVSALNTGEITEFCFVTNGSFSPAVREAITEANALLHGDEGNQIHVYEHVGFNV